MSEKSARITSLPTIPPEEPHGAIDHAELRALGLDPARVLDFSANINPYGPSPRVREALAAVDVARYPDRHALDLRDALAAHHALEPDHILVGNGTAELIWLVALAFLRPGDTALVLGPTFGEYARAARIARGRVVEWRARPEDHFAYRPDEIAAVLSTTAPRLCFLCSPNNPTGQICPPDALAAWADAHPNTLFVVDEAYINFVPDLESALALKRENILVLRSMTKDYALAGLRLGYAVGPRPLVDALRRVQPPWSVNAAAQAAGLAALSDPDHLRTTVAATLAEKDIFVRRLRDLGLNVLPSRTHFFLVEVGDAKAFRSTLLTRGILVRDCTSFGLPSYVRLSTRRPEENQSLISNLQSLSSLETGERRR